MDFTREPIIETIISPREGFKLLVRNSKGGTTEEFCVDAIEVVSFGHALFLRSLERPKCFLVPVGDYEVLEVKETRTALKNVSHERNIKIGGGREGPIRGGHHRAPAVEKEPEVESEEVREGEPATAEAPGEPRGEHNKRRDRRRRRHRRPSDEQEWTDQRRGGHEAPAQTDKTRAEGAEEGGGAEDETKVSSSMFTNLFPPPTTLISETIGRYKDKEFSQGNPLPKVTEEKKPPTDPDSFNTESTPLNRVASNEAQGFSSTSFGGSFDPLS